jgi:HPt (histidine-containing phosphotransfer) domain-containing protein
MFKPLDVEQLRPLYRDEPEALGALFRETIGATAVLIRKLAREVGSQRTTMHLAHELKGVCRTTGAEELAFLGGEIEDLAAEGSWDDIAMRLEMLELAHLRLVDAVASLA